MKHASTLAEPPALVPSDLAPRRRLAAWTNFWFAAVSPVALGRMRFLSGLMFFFWLLPFAGHVEAFYGLNGWFDRTAYVDSAELPTGPLYGLWSVLWVVGGNATLLTAVYWASLVIFLLFALGVWVRLTAVLTWIMVVSFAAAPAGSYDADAVVAMIAFYMLVGHLLLGQWSWNLSPLERVLGPKQIGIISWWRGGTAAELPGSHAANLAMRLLQVHFAMVLVTSGLYKLQSGDWWSGWAFWFPLHPPFQTSEASLDAEIAAGTVNFRYFVLSIIEYLVLAWQIGFPVFAWRRSWRVLLLGGAVVGWLGSVFLFRLPVFGPAYLLGCLSYLTPEEWLGWQHFMARLTGRAQSAPGVKEKFRPRVR